MLVNKDAYQREKRNLNKVTRLTALKNSEVIDLSWMGSIDDKVKHTIWIENAGVYKSYRGYV